MIEIIIFFLIAIIMLLWWSGKKKKTIKQEKVAEPVKNGFRGVQVIPCSNACNPAILVSKKVFLVAELPRLPLASCDQVYRCKCKLKYFDDRRQNEDRRSGSKILQDVFNGDDHRVQKKRGRRKDD